MPLHQQLVTTAASYAKFALLPDASRNFVRQNTPMTPVTPKQINRLQRSVSQTQETPDASGVPRTRNQQPETSNQQPPWTTPTLVPQNRSSARLHQPTAPPPRVAARARANRRELSRAETSDRRSEIAHGLRTSRLPQYLSMLEPTHRHLHDPRQRLHASLRI